MKMNYGWVFIERGDQPVSQSEGKGEVLPFLPQKGFVALQRVETR